MLKKWTIYHFYRRMIQNIIEFNNVPFWTKGLLHRIISTRRILSSREINRSGDVNCLWECMYLRTSDYNSAIGGSQQNPWFVEKCQFSDLRHWYAAQQRAVKGTSENTMPRTTRRECAGKRAKKHKSCESLKNCQWCVMCGTILWYFLPCTLKIKNTDRLSKSGNYVERVLLGFVERNEGIKERGG